MILTISPKDYQNFASRFKTKCYYLPAFHTEGKYRVPEGSGKFCLYHARLDRQLNHESAVFLVKKVFSELPFRLVIAGDGANVDLRNLISEHSNVKLKENLTEDEIKDLVRKSQINLMPSIGTTGMKQFLLHLLFNGRHLIAAELELEGMGFDGLYISAKNIHDWQVKITKMMSEPMLEEAFQSRYEKLNLHYNNKFNANILYGLILDNVQDSES